MHSWAQKLICGAQEEIFSSVCPMYLLLYRFFAVLGHGMKFLVDWIPFFLICGVQCLVSGILNPNGTKFYSNLHEKGI